MSFGSLGWGTSDRQRASLFWDYFGTQIGCDPGNPVNYGYQVPCSDLDGQISPSANLTE